MTTEQKATMIVTLCIVLAGGIVALDLALPLGVAAGVPYVGVVLVSLWLPRPQHVLYTAVAVSALIVAGYVWSEPSGMQWMVLANRFLALFAIWATALVGFQRQRIEASMQTETDELEQLYRTAPVALAVFDQDLRFLRLNDQMAALNGLPAAEHLGRSVHEIVPDVAVKAEPFLRQTLESGGALFDVELTGLSGENRADRHWLGSYYPLRAADGTVRAVGVMVQDITERKVREEQLHESDERFRQLTDNINEAFWMTSGDLSEVLFVSPAYEEIWGRSRHSLYESSVDWLSVVHPDDLAHIRAAFTKLLETGAFDEEYRLLRSDGSVRWVHDHAFPIKNKTGQTHRIVGVAEDITDRKEAERRLEKLNRTLEERVAEQMKGLRDRDIRQRALLNALPDMMFRFNRNGTFLDFSAERHAMLLMAPEEVVGGNIWQSPLPHDVAESIMRAANSALETGTLQTIAYELVMEGDVRYFEARLTKSGDDEVVSVVRDVTEQRQAEDHLRASEEQLRTILETAVDAIITINTRGIIESANSTTHRMFGYTRDELIGQNVRILMPQPYRDEHDRYIARYLETGKAKVIGAGLEVTGRRKDGTSFPLDLGISDSHHGRFTGILRDISQRKKLERRLAESQTKERQHMASELHDGIGSLLTGIGLLGSSLATQLRRADSPLASRADALVQGVEVALRQIRTVTHGLMPVEIVPDGLMEALRRLTDQCEAASGVTCRFACETPVPVDDATTATQLFRIAQEAVNNALRHAKAQHVTLTLAQEADFLTLQIADDGIGFQGNPGGHEGVGLFSMETRCKELGGTLSIGSGTLGGTIVECRIPWTALKSRRVSWS